MYLSLSTIVGWAVVFATSIDSHRPAELDWNLPSRCLPYGLSTGERHRIGSLGGRKKVRDNVSRGLFCRKTYRRESGDVGRANKRMREAVDDHLFLDETHRLGWTTGG